MSVSFVTAGDANYYRTIVLSVRQIASLYPAAEVYVYDFGLADTQVETLQRQHRANVIPWSFVPLVVNSSAFLCGARGVALRMLKPNWIAKQVAKENILANKVLCFSHFLDNYGGDFVFLDGDAMLTQALDEVLAQSDFHIGVTLRRLEEISLKRGRCQAINSGVLFFLGGTETNQAFVRAWAARMQRTREYLVEQSALTRLLVEFDAEAFAGYFRDTTVHAGQLTIKVRVLPCEIYNFNWIEEEINLERIKVLHLKSGRFRDRRMQEIVRDAIDQAANGSRVDYDQDMTT